MYRLKRVYLVEFWCDCCDSFCNMIVLYSSMKCQGAYIVPMSCHLESWGWKAIEVDVTRNVSKYVLFELRLPSVRGRVWPQQRRSRLPHSMLRILVPNMSMLPCQVIEKHYFFYGTCTFCSYFHPFQLVQTCALGGVSVMNHPNQGFETLIVGVYKGGWVWVGWG